MKVFIDTNAWLALEIKNDINHLRAKSAFKKYKARRAIFYTNDYVLSEVYTRLIYDIYLNAALKFHEQLKKSVEGSQLTVLEIDGLERERTWEHLEKYQDHKLSFTDATIIVNFTELRLNEIFTFDSHFREINLPTNLK